MRRFAIALCLVTINAAAWAQLPLPIGTWIKRPSPTPPMMRWSSNRPVRG